MRIVYPALFYSERDRAVNIAIEIAKMTHADDASNEACALYTGALCAILEAADEKSARNGIEAVFEKTVYNLEVLMREGRAGLLNPTGYVMDSMKCALFSFWQTDSFEQAVVFAANLGGDTDTIAAITGDLAGLFYGYEAIPERWTNALCTLDSNRIDVVTRAALKTSPQK